MAHDELKPNQFVVPIISLSDSNGTLGPFLGTGAFIARDSLLITAYHVIRDANHGVVITWYSQPARYAKANVLLTDPDADLALLEVPDYKPPYVFPLATADEIHLNSIVSCFEYGTTVVAGRHGEFSPANRLGNVTRLVEMTDLYGKAGEKMLELSFPALRGASGAPIYLNDSTRLVGVMTANVNRELLPAHIEKITDETGKVTEETRFLLPQGLAIHVDHVRALVERWEKIRG